MYVEKTPIGYVNVSIYDRATHYLIYSGIVTFEYRKQLVNDNSFIVITEKKGGLAIW